jgi:hypothetical protein
MIKPRPQLVPVVLAHSDQETHDAFLAAQAKDSRASVLTLTEALQKAFGLETDQACDITIAWLKLNGR